MCVCVRVCVRERVCVESRGSVCRYEWSNVCVCESGEGRGGV